MPEELLGKEYYKPTDNGFDKVLKERLEIYKKERNSLK